MPIVVEHSPTALLATLAANAGGFKTREIEADRSAQQRDEQLRRQQYQDSQVRADQTRQDQLSQHDREFDAARQEREQRAFHEQQQLNTQLYIAQQARNEARRRDDENRVQHVGDQAHQMLRDRWLADNKLLLQDDQQDSRTFLQNDKQAGQQQLQQGNLAGKATLQQQKDQHADQQRREAEKFLDEEYAAKRLSPADWARAKVNLRSGSKTPVGFTTDPQDAAQQERRQKGREGLQEDQQTFNAEQQQKRLQLQEQLREDDRQFREHQRRLDRELQERLHKSYGISPTTRQAVQAQSAAYTAQDEVLSQKLDAAMNTKPHDVQLITQLREQRLALAQAKSNLLTNLAGEAAAGAGAMPGGQLPPTDPAANSMMPSNPAPAAPAAGPATQPAQTPQQVTGKDGRVWTFTGKYDAQGKPLYMSQ